MARRALRSKLHQRKPKNDKRLVSPFSWLTHLLDHTIESVLASLLQSLGDALVPLLVRGKFKKSSNKMIKSQLLVLLRAVFQD
jgi:hypothetical protein